MNEISAKLSYSSLSAFASFLDYSVVDSLPSQRCNVTKKLSIFDVVKLKTDNVLVWCDIAISG